VAVLPAVIAGVSSLAGGALANRSRRMESARNRRFQERMRNTQWQATVADMQAAGINPALAYQQGPNAAPGGSMAQQMDAISPAVSSAMQMKRMTADLKQIDAATEKLKAEAAGARSTALSAKLRADLDQARTSFMLSEIGPAGERKYDQLMQSEVDKAMYQANLLGPLGELSGAFLPVIRQLSQMSAGGMQQGMSSRFWDLLRFELSRPPRALGRGVRRGANMYARPFKGRTGSAVYRTLTRTGRSIKSFFGG
jgi:hypothetical protein